MWDRFRNTQWLYGERCKTFTDWIKANHKGKSNHCGDIPWMTWFTDIFGRCGMIGMRKLLRSWITILGGACEQWLAMSMKFIKLSSHI